LFCRFGLNLVFLGPSLWFLTTVKLLVTSLVELKMRADVGFLLSSIVSFLVGILLILAVYFVSEIGLLWTYYSTFTIVPVNNTALCWRKENTSSFVFSLFKVFCFVFIIRFNSINRVICGLFFFNSWPLCKFVKCLNL